MLSMVSEGISDKSPRGCINEWFWMQAHRAGTYSINLIRNPHAALKEDVDLHTAHVLRIELLFSPPPFPQSLPIIRPKIMWEKDDVLLVCVRDVMSPSVHRDSRVPEHWFYLIATAELSLDVANMQL